MKAEKIFEKAGAVLIGLVAFLLALTFIAQIAEARWSSSPSWTYGGVFNSPGPRYVAHPVRDPNERLDFLYAHGFTRTPKGFIVDHIAPLECNGADVPANMQLQTTAAAAAKDQAENAWAHHGCK